MASTWSSSVTILPCGELSSFLIARSDHLYFVLFHCLVWTCLLFYFFAWSDHFFKVLFHCLVLPFLFSFNPCSLSSFSLLLKLYTKSNISKLTDKLEDILVEMVYKVLKIIRGVIEYLWLLQLDSTCDSKGTSSSYEFKMCIVSNKIKTLQKYVHKMIVLLLHL